MSDRGSERLMMDAHGGVPEAASRATGEPTLLLGSTVLNGHEGWIHETPDGQRWFIPDAAARTIHRASHHCQGGCPALKEHVQW